MATTVDNTSSILNTLGANTNNSRSSSTGTDYSNVGKSQSYYDAKTVAEESQSQILNQEDFLKLLTTQLQCQDPTQPVDNSQMVTQLSQMSMVESLTSINTGMSDIISAVSSSSALTASSLVGRSVLVDTQTGFFDGMNPITCKIDAGDGYSDIKIVVKDANGQIVDEYTAAGGKGTMDFAWDGIKGGVDDGGDTDGDVDVDPDDGGETTPSEDGDGTADGTETQSRATDVEYYDSGMYTIEAVGIDMTTGKQVQLPVSMYAVVGSVTLGSTMSETLLNLVGYGEIPFSEVKEVAL